LNKSQLPEATGINHFKASVLGCDSNYGVLLALMDVFENDPDEDAARGFMLELCASAMLKMFRLLLISDMT
jgi:hypothetical protein